MKTKLSFKAKLWILGLYIVCIGLPMLVLWFYVMARIVAWLLG